MADDEQRPRWRTAVEIAEVTVLAIVAIATAWSGYQATQWGGRQTVLYGQASSTRFQADALSTLGGQQLVADSSMFTAWLVARQSGDAEPRASSSAVSAPTLVLLLYTLFTLVDQPRV